MVNKNSVVKLPLGFYLLGYFDFGNQINLTNLNRITVAVSVHVICELEECDMCRIIPYSFLKN